MKAISLHQPYASLIANGFKTFETRLWLTSYRGKLAIHAAKRKPTSDEISYLIYRLGKLSLSEDKKEEIIEIINLISSKDLPLGSVIAIADLKNCREMVGMATNDSNKICIHTVTNTIEGIVGYWQVNRCAWELSDIHTIKPIPARGQQGLFNIDLTPPSYD